MGAAQPQRSCTMGGGGIYRNHNPTCAIKLLECIGFYVCDGALGSMAPPKIVSKACALMLLVHTVRSGVRLFDSADGSCRCRAAANLHERDAPSRTTPTWGGGTPQEELFLLLIFSCRCVESLSMCTPARPYFWSGPRGAQSGIRVADLGTWPLTSFVAMRRRDCLGEGDRVSASKLPYRTALSLYNINMHMQRGGDSWGLMLQL